MSCLDFLRISLKIIGGIQKLKTMSFLDIKKKTSTLYLISEYLFSFDYLKFE